MSISKEKNKNEIIGEIRRFASAIDSLAMTVETAMDSLEIAHRAAHKSYDSYVEKYGEVSKRDGQEYVKMRSHEYCHDYGTLSRNLDRVHAAQHVVPPSFLVALVSRYDALLGGIVRALFRSRPELLKSSERQLTFAQLADFDSIDNAREFVLEKEVETLLRKSHPEQFEWLEKKFDIELRKDLPEWPAFVEFTERRNLFVHADVVVSSQYLSNCNDEGVDLPPDTKVGNRLSVSQGYFKKAHQTLFELGLKLGQVLWRKVVPTAPKDADLELIYLTDDLLFEGKYQLAKVLLDFADTTLGKRHASEWHRLTFVVNRALAYDLGGNKEKCAAILAGQDWSATADAFKLAESVLLDKFESAAKLMKKIGADGDPHKGDYLHAPLFATFRKSPQFMQTFREVFGDDTHEEHLQPKEPLLDSKVN